MLNLAFQYCIFICQGTRWTRLQLSYKDIPLFGNSIAVELDKEGSPTGRGIGHIAKNLSNEVSDHLNLQMFGATNYSLFCIDINTSILILHYSWDLQHLVLLVIGRW